MECMENTSKMLARLSLSKWHNGNGRAQTAILISSTPVILSCPGISFHVCGSSSPADLTITQISPLCGSHQRALISKAPISTFVHALISTQSSFDLDQLNQLV